MAEDGECGEETLGNHANIGACFRCGDKNEAFAGIEMFANGGTRFLSEFLELPRIDIELDGVETARFNCFGGCCPGCRIVDVVTGVTVVVDANRIAKGAA